MFLLPLVLLFCPAIFGAEDYSETNAAAFINELDKTMGLAQKKATYAAWDYEVDLTEEKKKVMIDTVTKVASQTKDGWKETIKFPWQTFKDKKLKRMFYLYSTIGAAALPPKKFERFTKISSDMLESYGKGKVCDYKDKTKCDLRLDSEITDIIAKSRDPEELKHYWTAWRDATGKKYKSLYAEMVELLNEGAKLNNFTDAAAEWKSDFESETFDADIEKLWLDVYPLYKELHAYIRRKLYLKYGENVVSKSGPIPAHLLGNMWGQSWGNLEEIAMPYPDKVNKLSLDEELKKQNYTTLKFFQMAEDFFVSLGFQPMTEEFWKYSVLEKPKDREIVCHASAWDFFDAKDFRIKMCTQPKFFEFLVVHHEMGHIQYYMEYRDQPFIFRRGANSGFHEAIGDIMSLSVRTNKHLTAIGLAQPEARDEESEINSLFSSAIRSVAFLPFGYLIDQYRWMMFEGKVKPENYNCKWWELREKYQGLEPPVERSEIDFDAGSKYHIPGNTPYIRYFVSAILQFQFLESLCKEAGQYDPNVEAIKHLHHCDIYKSKEAGALLRKMLQMGSSQPWPEALEVVTGKRTMDSASILNYHKPLYDWLKKENAKTEEYIGWKASNITKRCPEKK